MNVLALRARLIAEYRDYVTSFVEIADARIKERVTQALDEGALWPEPLDLPPILVPLFKL